jgi:hypothetical protein
MALAIYLTQYHKAKEQIMETQNISPCKNIILLKETKNPSRNYKSL